MANAQLSIMAGGSLMADLLLQKPPVKGAGSSTVSFDAFLAKAEEDVETPVEEVMGQNAYDKSFTADAMNENDHVGLDEELKAAKPQEREDRSEVSSTDVSRSSAESGLSGGTEAKIASIRQADDRKSDDISVAKADGVDKEEDVKTLEKRLRDYIAVGDRAKAKEILESLKGLIKSGKIDSPKDLILRLSALLSDSGYLGGDDQLKSILGKLQAELTASIKGMSAAAKPKHVSSGATGEVSKEKSVLASESDLKGSRNAPNLLVKSASSDLKGLRGSKVLLSSGSDKAAEGTLKDRSAGRLVKAGVESSTYRTLEPSAAEEPNPSAKDGLVVVVKKASGRLIGLKHEGSYESAPKPGTGEKLPPASERSAGQPMARDTMSVAQRAVREAASSVSESVKEKSVSASKDTVVSDKKISPDSLGAASSKASSRPVGEQPKGTGQASNYLASQETSNGQRSSQSQSASSLSQSREVTPPHVFRQIVQKAQIMVSSGLAEMKLELKPENLGKLHLKLEMQGGILTAKFMAESQQVKELIESNLSQLRQSLSDQGLSFGKIEVSVGSGGGERGFEEGRDVPYVASESVRGLQSEAPHEEVSYDLAMVARWLNLDGATVNYLA